jgi:hypothetical protein
MPSIEKHADISKQRTGKAYQQVHEWIDDPQHKGERHDITRVLKFSRMFREKYGEEAAREYVTDAALLRMAKVINAADTGRLDADPLAAGFEAIAVGYGLRFPDDLEKLENQFAVYDARYAWCRLDAVKETS